MLRARGAWKVLGAVPRAVFLGFWTLLIVVASFLPQGSRAARAFTLNGRVFLAHLVAYGVLSTLVFLTLKERPLTSRVGPMVLLPILFGGVVEVLQPFAGRGFASHDLLANTVGVVIAVVVVSFGILLREKVIRPHWRRAH